MEIVKQLLLCVFISCGGLANAQVPADPQFFGKDGLPATTPNRTNYREENQSRESINRTHFDRVENQDQFEEQISSQEKQKASHFRADTISVFFFDEKGRAIKNFDMYQEQIVQPDSVETNYNYLQSDVVDSVSKVK